MASEFLDIPGNIKQMYLPFVLDPDNGIFKTPIKYKGAEKDTSTDTTLVSHSSQTKFQNLQQMLTASLQQEQVDC